MERYMILLKPGGKCRLIPCDKDGTLTLQAMQVLVDGPIETAASILGPCWAREPVDSIKLILNEEGKFRRLTLNEDATDLYAHCGRDMIVGDALLAAARGDELIGFSEPVCQTLAEFWGAGTGSVNGRNKRWAEQRWDKRQPERLAHIRKKKEDKSHEKAKKPLPEAGPPHRGRRV